MTVSKYLAVLFTVLFHSCGNNPTGISKANIYYTHKPIDTVRKISGSQHVDSALLKTWSAFQKAVSTNNISQFQQLSLDSINACDTMVSTVEFIKHCYKQFFDTSISKKISLPTEINQIDITMEVGYFSQSLIEKADFVGNVISIKQFQIVKEINLDGAWTVTIDFIKTKKGYKFFGCDSYGGPICCR